MASPTVVPTKYAGDDGDFLIAPCDRSGAVRLVQGSVTVPDATAEGAFIGLIPFNSGARFVLNDKSIHVTDIDSGTDSLLNVGIIYESGEGTDDVDAYAAASTAGQAGGFISLTNVAGLSTVTTGKGWLAVENDTNVTEAEGTITFAVGVAYDG
jgi:hypothetical protein